MCNLKVGQSQKAHCALMLGSICLQTWKVVKSLYSFVFLFLHVQTFTQYNAHATFSSIPAFILKENKEMDDNQVVVVTIHRECVM